MQGFGGFNHNTGDNLWIQGIRQISITDNSGFRENCKQEDCPGFREFRQPAQETTQSLRIEKQKILNSIGQGVQTTHNRQLSPQKIQTTSTMDKSGSWECRKISKIKNSRFKKYKQQTKYSIYNSGLKENVYSNCTHEHSKTKKE